MASSASNNLSFEEESAKLWEEYEFFGIGDVSAGEMERIKKLAAPLGKYSFLGNTFLNPRFDILIKTEIKDNDQKINKETIYESEIPCKKCGAKSTIGTPIQTRAADEPLSYKYTCLKCGYNWKET